MAKAKTQKKPRARTPMVNDPPLTDQKAQVKVLRLNSETYTKCKIQCFVCNEEDTERDVTEVEFARGLYREGWRVVCSEKFQTIGAMCPECVKTPDKDRGE